MMTKPVNRIKSAWGALTSVERIGFLFAWGWLLISMILFAGFTYDDAYISLRYAANLASGNGYSFNPGEKVEGASNPLWVLILSGCAKLGIPLLPMAKALGALATLTVPWLQLGMSRQLSPARPNVVGVWLTALAAPVAFWAVDGLETGVVASLITLGTVLTLADVALPGKIGISAAPVWLAVALLRPEGAIFILPYLAAVIAEAIRQRRSFRGPFIAAAIVLGGTAGLMLWRWSIFESLVPNTYWVKVANHSLYSTGTGLSYLRDFLFEWGGPLLPLAAVLSLYWSIRGGWIPPCLFAAIVLCQIGFIVLVERDWMAGWRFVVPVWPILAMLAGSGLYTAWSTVRSRLSQIGKVIMLIALGVCAVVFAGRNLSRLKYAIGPEGYGRHGLHGEVGRYIKGAFRSDSTIALSDVGEIPYESGLRVIDLLGLTDAFIARHKPAEGAAYVLQRAPELILLAQQTRRIQGNMEIAAPKGPVERLLYSSPEFKASYEPNRVWPFSKSYDLVLYVRRDYQKESP